jgi:hypothetical protein
MQYIYTGPVGFRENPRGVIVHIYAPFSVCVCLSLSPPPPPTLFLSLALALGLTLSLFMLCMRFHFRFDNLLICVQPLHIFGNGMLHTCFIDFKTTSLNRSLNALENDVWQVRRSHFIIF